RAVGTLAQVAERRGDLGASVQYAEASLQIALELGDLDTTALSYGNLGLAHHILGDRSESPASYVRALECYRESQALNRRLGRRAAGGLTAAHEALLHVRLGHDRDARRCVVESLTLGRSAGSVFVTMTGAIAEADRRVNGGDIAGALDLVGLVMRHPAFDDN